MKPTILTILLLASVLVGFSNKQVQLPEEPWKAIIEMTKYSPNYYGNGNISVKMRSNTSARDSMLVENAIQKLNSLLTRVQLETNSNEKASLEIVFLDSTNIDVYKDHFNIDPNNQASFPIVGRKFNDDSPYLSHNLLILHLKVIPESVHQNYVTNQMAFALFPNFWHNDLGLVNGKYVGQSSIFVSFQQDKNPLFSEMNSFDKKIIQAVYSDDFKRLFPIAKKQFGKFEFAEWMRRYSPQVLIFPFVLTVFLLVGLLIFLYRKLFSRIRDKWLQLNAISILALPLLGVLISLYFMTALTLKHPYAIHLNWSNFLAGIFLTTLLGLPAVNLIRLIETIIHRKTQQKYFKVLLLFLSTSLLPSGTLISIAYFSFKKNLNDEGIHAMILIFLTFVFIGIIRALISFFILKEKEIKIETEVKLANLRELKTKAELNALHSKINPHFLYNALNSIAGLAKTDAEKTEHMALSLSKLFRYSINKEQSDWSTFEEELNMVRIYLDIEKVRFNERLEFSINLPNELRSAQVPRFLIQPLAENSVKHGISKLTEKGQIQISVAQNGKYTEISVRDNGPDFPNELIPGFGLQSIHDKLEILYPNRFELHFVHSPNKKILIKLF